VNVHQSRRVGKNKTIFYGTSFSAFFSPLDQT